MITNHNFVVTVNIIKSIIVYKLFFLFLIIFFMSATTARILNNLLIFSIFFRVLLGLLTIYFVSFRITDEIYHIVIKYFSFFKIRKLIYVISQNILRCSWQLRHLLFGSYWAQAECCIYQTSWDVLHRMIKICSLLRIIIHLFSLRIGIIGCSLLNYFILNFYKLFFLNRVIDITLIRSELLGLNYLLFALCIIVSCIRSLFECVWLIFFICIALLNLIRCYLFRVFQRRYFIFI